MVCCRESVDGICWRSLTTVCRAPIGQVAGVAAVAAASRLPVAPTAASRVRRVPVVVRVAPAVCRSSPWSGIGTDRRPPTRTSPMVGRCPRCRRCTAMPLVPRARHLARHRRRRRLTTDRTLTLVVLWWCCGLLWCACCVVHDRETGRLAAGWLPDISGYAFPSFLWLPLRRCLVVCTYPCAESLADCLRM